MLEQRGRENREKARAERHTPEANAKREKGRLARNRGMKFDGIAAKYLEGTKVPMSGALACNGVIAGDNRFRGDVRKGWMQIQCKRISAFATIRRQLSGQDYIVITPGQLAGYETALVAMRGVMFKQLINDPTIYRLMRFTVVVNTQTKGATDWLDEDHSDILIQAEQKESMSLSLVIMRYQTFQRIVREGISEDGQVFPAVYKNPLLK